MKIKYTKSVSKPNTHSELSEEIMTVDAQTCNEVFKLLNKIKLSDLVTMTKVFTKELLK